MEECYSIPDPRRWEKPEEEKGYRSFVIEKLKIKGNCSNITLVMCVICMLSVTSVRHCSHPVVIVGMQAGNSQPK